MKDILAGVQVNIPMTWLMDGYLDRFIGMGINPEIGLDATALDRFPLEAFQTVGDLFRDKGLSITVHGPFMDLSPSSPDPDIVAVGRKRFRQLFRVIPALAPVSVVAHGGYDPRRHYFMADEWLERSLAFFWEVSDRLHDLGCRLMLENVYEDKPEDLLKLVRELDPAKTGICLDVGHMNAMSSESLSVWLSVLGHRIGEMHLHDNHGDRDSHLPMGQGTVAFDRVFAFIKEHRPIMTLEPHEEKELYASLDYLSKHVSAWKATDE